MIGAWSLFQWNNSNETSLENCKKCLMRFIIIK